MYLINLKGMTDHKYILNSVPSLITFSIFNLQHRDQGIGDYLIKSDNVGMLDQLHQLDLLFEAFPELLELLLLLRPDLFGGDLDIDVLLLLGPIDLKSGLH